ncbi:MAG TPA: ATP-dependent DNA ligase, partial [Planctomycetota bacterium]|nr:ATP-dependent DNA ligase [Planctomycetota bacterium]
MQLADLVACSNAVAATRARGKKTEAIAATLAAAAAAERRLAALWLAGQLRQEKIGVGFAQVHDALANEAAPTATLTLADVDGALEAIASMRGAGSAARRQQALSELFARATQPEQQFLAGLLTGELRQGALESLVLDAIARAVSLPPAA